MKASVRHIILLFLGTLGCTSCYTYRYVPEGEHVLYKNKMEVAMADSSEVTPEVKDALKNARNYYLQKPNSKLLGIDRLRVGMNIYGIANPKDRSFLGNYDADKAAASATQLQRLLQAKGCFGSTVTYDTLKLTRHNITVGYHVTATPRYIVDEVNYRSDNEAVRRLLEDWRDASPLKANTPYDQDNIAAERTRLVNNLREAGYYRATTDLVTFEVDTTYSSSRLSIDVLVDGRALSVYHINNIYIYPNSIAGLRDATSVYDTLI